MINIKSGRDLALMREACVISARALQLGGEAVQPGVTTGEIDRIIRKYIESMGAKPSFLGYSGYPASACISVNNEVIHGIPGNRKSARATSSALTSAPSTTASTATTPPPLVRARSAQKPRR